jgi:NAD(P)-dependent dehydrogenase (short-subunit alcohol dehydrogenase family)
MPRLNGKVALITGGASGIGEATVRLFVEEGATVVVVDIQDNRGQQLAKELGSRAAYVHADVSREVDIRAAVTAAVERHGRLDCLFNNAGFAGIQGRIEEITVSGFDETTGVLLRGVFLGMKHAAPIMKRQGSGSIISTASVAGLRAGMGPHIYSAAKAAVIHLTQSVAMELGESGIRVNCICPGGIATPIFGKAVGLPSDEARDGLGEARLAQPDCCGRRRQTNADRSGLFGVRDPIAGRMKDRKVIGLLESLSQRGRSKRLEPWRARRRTP